MYAIVFLLFSLFVNMPLINHLKMDWQDVRRNGPKDCKMNFQPILDHGSDIPRIHILYMIRFDHFLWKIVWKVAISMCSSRPFQFPFDAINFSFQQKITKNNVNMKKWFVFMRKTLYSKESIPYKTNLIECDHPVNNRISFWNKIHQRF